MEVIVQPSCQLKGESVVVAECFILSFHSGHSQVHRSDLSSSSDNKHVSTHKTITARKPQRRLSVSCQFWTPSFGKSIITINEVIYVDSVSTELDIFPPEILITPEGVTSVAAW